MHSKIYRKPYILALVCFSFFTFNINAQTIPLDAKVRTGKLANGFTYYIRHNEEPKNRVTFYLANKVGAVLEDDDQRGLAHFMEHMSFNGTTHFPKNELINYLQKSGVRFGADINAYTSFDETVYQLPLPSDNPEIVKNGVLIMHDWANGATLDDTEINKERGVVLEEKRLGRGAGDRMRTKYFPVILNNSRYADRLPIGTEEVLSNFKPEAIKRFYRDWYRPNLQALIVVGDINVDEMEKIIKLKFADLKNPVKPRVRTKYSVPLTGKNQFIAVTDPEMPAINVEVTIKQPELKLHTKAEYRSNIIRGLYNQMMAERYTELQRQAEPPFLNGGAGIDKFLGGLDAYTVSVTAKPGELEEGFKAAWRENYRVKRFGFTESELARAKTSYQSQFEAMLREKNKTRSESYVNEYLQHFLHGTASPGIDYEYKLVTENLAGITLNELNTLAKTIIKSTDRDILLMAPEKDKAGLPTEATFNTWMKDVEAENLTRYQDETSTETLLMKEPVAGKIVSETKDAKLGIITLALSNGIKVLLKPTDFRNNEVSFSGFAPGGTSLYSDADYQSASAADIVPEFGAGNYNATVLTKYLSGKQLSVQTSIGERAQTISGGAVNSDLEAALQLVYAYVTEPRKDTAMFHGMMQQAKGSLVNRLNDPNSVFQDTISAVLSNYSVRRSGPSVEKIDQINLDKAYSVYKERFADLSGFTFVFVGSIDTITIRPLIEKYIASLPANGKTQQAKDLNINIPPGLIEKIVYKGSEPKATVRLVFSGAFDYSFENKLKMDALKETLQIRMLERLREDESGVYSPGVQMNTVKLPKGRFSTIITFGCAPQNVDKLIASALDEVNKIKTDGPPQINVDKFKAETQRGIETALKNNGFWLGYLNTQLQNEEKLDEIDHYIDQLNKITPADVKQVAEKYLTGKNYIKLVLLPEDAGKPGTK
ncbi:insulinase family protein [Mucilaginibacter limnophilus]|uniref:Insulinase family protein n=1 Tax=Mucilaginibacter limnophilus TaxID=1932778 RepID=A0A437MST2_9SPHI|nr:M16 family metallopeptidase [Mucilaginibacter limnophilus]RVU00700.1 insulinase family protein [Mucilaginibacter limnophilus]